MDEEHLGKTGVGADSCSTKPEDGQHLRQSGEGENQVNKGEHGKKEKHGPMKAALGPDKKKQNTIPSHCQEQHEAKRKSEIQMWAAVSPGMPAKKKVCGKL